MSGKFIVFHQKLLILRHFFIPALGVDQTPKLAFMIFLALVILPLASCDDVNSSENPLREIQASEILTKIQNGEPVEYDHVIVKGDLNISRSSKQTNISSPIRINDSTFDNLVNFAYAVLDKPIDLSGSDFVGLVNFTYAILDESTDLSNSNFTKNAYFEESIFGGGASFSDTVFTGDAHFKGSVFSEDADFRDANFIRDADFRNVTFSEDAGFSRANFKGDAGFSGANFSEGSDIESRYNALNSIDISRSTYNKSIISIDDIIISGRGSGGAISVGFYNISSIFGADFSGATFSGDVDFLSANFTGSADFGGSNFYHRAIFMETTFFENADFSGAIFNGAGTEYGLLLSNIMPGADFSGANFKKYVEYDKTLFKSATFEDAKFNEYANFRDATFDNDINFNKATFGEDAFFGGSIFGKGDDFYAFNYHLPTFKGTVFGNVYFEGVNFSRDINFNEAIFGGYTWFHNANFYGNAAFKGATFRGHTHFTEDKFNRNVDFEKSTFKNVVDLNGTLFNGYFFGWDYIKNALKCEEVTYLRLIKNFRDHGQFNEADQCYYQYRYQYMSGPIDWLGWISCGFGVRLDHIIGCSIFIVLIFAVFYLRTKCIYKLSNSTRALKPKQEHALSVDDAFFFSALVFFTLHPPHDWEYSRNSRYWVLFEDILGGALIALFIVVLGNIIIR